MRTKFYLIKNIIPQDNLNITVNEKSILKSYKFIQKLIENLKRNFLVTLSRTFLTKNKLYRTNGKIQITKNLLDVMSFCDGNNAVDDISSTQYFKQERKVLNKLSLKYRFLKLLNSVQKLYKCSIFEQ